MSIKAIRGGETCRVWSYDPCGEKISLDEESLVFEFSIPSKGGGVTVVNLRIRPDSFEEIAKAMLAADDDAAIRAFRRRHARADRSRARKFIKHQTQPPQVGTTPLQGARAAPLDNFPPPPASQAAPSEGALSRVTKPRIIARIPSRLSPYASYGYRRASTNRVSH